MGRANNILQGLGTVLMIVGWACAAYGAVPINYVASAVGCFLWTVVGVRKGDTQIIFLDACITILSILAILNYLHKGGTLWMF